MSQTFDGARLTLLTAVPYTGRVVVKLLAPVFLGRFLYECLRQASPRAEMSASLSSLLGLRRPSGIAEGVLGARTPNERRGMVESCCHELHLSPKQRAILVAIS